MNPFLQQIAHQIYQDHANELGETTVIFPNRRAGLYFREYLKKEISGPVWSPVILSFQDFVAYQSESQLADKLFLTHRLYKIYSDVLKSKEGFDRFYYWGQMLLKDFDDVDKYLVDPENLYANLSRQKQLDLTFDFLDEEQKAIIKRFWQGFEQTKSEQKERFQFVWERLFAVYSKFQQSLKKEGLAYEGMQYRFVAENLDTILFKNLNGPVVFAGFNAFNLAEDQIITWFIKNRGAKIYWDVDDYYMREENQEAGKFFRDYKKRTIFENTFPKELPRNLKAKTASMTLTGVPEQIGQAKIVGQKLQELLKENPALDLRKVAIVLADESLLFPVLHSLPEKIEAINVTMGFPLTNAPLNSLIEHILDMQLRRNKQGLFHYKSVLAILKHPLVMAQDSKAILSLTAHFEKENKVFIDREEFKNHPLLTTIFTYVDKDLIGYLTGLLLELHKSESEIEVEYIHQFFKLFNRYGELLEGEGQAIDIRLFSRLFKQLIRSERLPFSGEPLNGLQIMGVLETRNLDFEHVFLLSMNEDFFPSQGGKHSFIPYNLRKAYGLPNYDQQDAIYAYLFYRLLQRPKHTELFYNTEGNDVGGGEMSRFVQQLLHETDWIKKHQIASSSANLEKIGAIKIEKNEQIRKSMKRFLVNGQDAAKRLSPSALNTYLECRLRFFFRYVANLYEKDDMDDDVDARSFGNVLHDAMDRVYTNFLSERKTRAITKADINSLRKNIDHAIEQAFRKQFSVPDTRKFEFEGKNIIAREITKEYMVKILELDSQYAPFEFYRAEKKFKYNLKVPSIAGKELLIGLEGTIDRIDKKDGSVRLIDYKTGRDTHTFNSIASLFDPEDKNRNKAAFQTFYYALLYEQDRNENETPIPAVFNRETIFQGASYQLKLDKTPVTQADSFMLEYLEHLTQLLSELFNPEVPFDQTADEKKCEYCAYKGICGR